MILGELLLYSRIKITWSTFLHGFMHEVIDKVEEIVRRLDS